MWQFAEATRGLADACQALGVPVTGGNVSFYNQTGATAINPTPVIGVLGIIDDVRRRTPVGFPAADLVVLLLGTTHAELGGSEWANEVHGHLGGLPPRVDLAGERNLAQLLVRAAEEEVLAGAHDLSDGGLAQALVESCLHSNVGLRVALEGDPFVALFSESTARVLVALQADDVERFTGGCNEHGIAVTRLGTTGGDSLAVDGQFEIPLTELRTAYEGTLPRLFG
jgi:phosphoribosylformylglycinamidine synthase